MSDSGFTEPNPEKIDRTVEDVPLWIPPGEVSYHREATDHSQSILQAGWSVTAGHCIINANIAGFTGHA